MTNKPYSNQPYTIDINGTNIQTVGKIDLATVHRLTGLTFPSADVRIFPGALKHIRKKHAAILNQYGHLIPSIIARPDYIGRHPNNSNSVELIKKVGTDVLLSIELDPSGYLYISSFYELNNAPVKIQKRLDSGRIVQYS